MSERDKRMARARARANGDTPGLGGAFNGVDDDLVALIQQNQRSGNSVAITRNDDGRLQIGGIHLGIVGASIDSTVTWDELSAFLALLAQVDQSLPWWIADAAAAAEKRYGQTYDELAAISGLTVGTLQTYANVSRAIETSNRFEDLSFGHHTIVASKTAEVQQRYLNIARDQGWSMRVFADAVAYADTRERDLADVLEDFLRTVTTRHSTIQERIEAAGEKLRIDAERRLRKNPQARDEVIAAARAESQRLQEWADALAQN